MHRSKAHPALSSCVFLTLFLLRATAFGQGGTANSWIKPSGNWDDPSGWSLGALPNSSQSIFITNQGWKAVAINPSTPINFPNSMTVGSLTVKGAWDTFNTLLLNSAGVTVPLRINADLRLGTNSALVSHYSALQAPNFYLGGNATFDELSEARFGQVSVGLSNSVGALNLLSGNFDAGSIAVNSQSTLTVTNGAILNVGGLGLNLPATGGVAVLNVSGAVAVSNAIDIGWGNITFSGGYFQTPGISVFQGELRQSGGTNDLGGIRLPRGRLYNGQGTFYLSGGTLFTSTLSLGDATPGGFTYYNGVFEQTGGVHTNSAGITTWGVLRQALRSISGTYRLKNGSLITPFLQEMEGGGFEQSGGTNHVGTISVDDASSFGLSGGSLTSSNTSVTSGYGDYTIYRNLQGVYSQTDGSHEVQGLFRSGEGGDAQLQGGWLKAQNISVGPLGGLGLSGAAVTNSGTFTIFSSGRISASGNYQELGKLILTVGPPPSGWPPSEWPSRAPATLLTFGSGTTTIHFRDSHDVAWNVTLGVVNWQGSTNGNGTDRLYVGTSAQGLTRSQLDLIHFINPAGLPAGTYPATILATGEVVPAPRPTVNFTRSSNGMIISWSGNYQLFSSTNVAGPYAPVNNASSPYTNAFSEPQRFFFLRSP